MIKNRFTSAPPVKGMLMDEATNGSVLAGVFSQNDRAPSPAYRHRNKQRLAERFKQRIECKYYDPIQDDFYAFEGVILSLRVDGLTFLTERSVETGAPILIRRKTPLKDGDGDPLDDGMHVQVVSCKKTDSLTGIGSYQISVQYFQVF